MSDSKIKSGLVSQHPWSRRNNTFQYSLNCGPLEHWSHVMLMGFGENKFQGKTNGGNTGKNKECLMLIDIVMVGPNEYSRVGKGCLIQCGRWLSAVREIQRERVEWVEDFFFQARKIKESTEQTAFKLNPKGWVEFRIEICEEELFRRRVLEKRQTANKTYMWKFRWNGQKNSLFKS